MNKKQPEIWLTGYLERSVDEIVELARRFQFEAIVDVCDISDYQDSGYGHYRYLRDTLSGTGVAFHLAGRQLGVFPASPNQSIHSELDFFMRGFADHMHTEVFKMGITQLTSLARDQRTLVISGNHDFEISSRDLIADYLFLIEGFKVSHIAATDLVRSHQPAQTARVVLENIIYDRVETEHQPYH